MHDETRTLFVTDHLFGPSMVEGSRLIVNPPSTLTGDIFTKGVIGPNTGGFSVQPGTT